MVLKMDFSKEPSPRPQTLSRSSESALYKATPPRLRRMAYLVLMVRDMASSKAIQYLASSNP